MLVFASFQLMTFSAVVMKTIYLCFYFKLKTGRGNVFIHENQSVVRDQRSNKK